MSVQIDGSTGNIIATKADYSGDVSIGGTLTYEDVTNIDSVGLITARNGIKVDDLGVQVGTGATIDGATNTLTFLTNGSERVRITSGGNIGINASSPDGTLHVHSGSAGSVTANGNADDLIVESSGTGGISILTPDANTGYLIFGSPTSNEGAILRYSDNNNLFTIGTEDANGVLQFRTGAGTEAARIDSSGRLMLGTTTEGYSSGDDLTIATSGHTGITLRSGTTSEGAVYFSDATSGGGEYVGSLVYSHNTNSMNFTANGAERMRIDSSGNVGVNATSPGRTLDVDGVIRSDGTSGAFELGGNSSTPSVGCAIHRPANNTMAFVTGTSERMRINSSGFVGINETSPGSQLTVKRANTSTSGLLGVLKLKQGSATNGNRASLLFSALDDFDVAAVNGVIETHSGTESNNVGRLEFYTKASGSSIAERLRITSTGDVTTTGNSTFNRANAGFTARNGDSVSITRNSGTPLEINRGTNDGNLVNFFQGGTIEGIISVSGSTVTYGGGHLARWSQLAGGAGRTEILRGSVLSNLDEMCEWGEEDNEQLNRMKISDVEGDVKVSGVFVRWDDDDDTYTNDFYCAMTGDFVIRIAQGTTVANGDLLMSAGDGTAKPQDDDIVRSKTIAKVTSTTVSATYADGSYCVPCVLMAC